MSEAAWRGGGQGVGVGRGDKGLLPSEDVWQRDGSGRLLGRISRTWCAIDGGDLGRGRVQGDLGPASGTCIDGRGTAAGEQDCGGRSSVALVCLWVETCWGIC